MIDQRRRRGRRRRAFGSATTNRFRSVTRLLVQLLISNQQSIRKSGQRGPNASFVAASLPDDNVEDDSGQDDDNNDGSSSSGADDNRPSVLPANDRRCWCEHIRDGRILLKDFS